MSLDPKPLNCAAAWYGADMQDSSSWQIELDEGDCLELENALNSILADGVGLADIRRHNFPLDKLCAKLRRAGELLEDGPGFVRISGFPVDRWRDGDRALAWMGLASYIGEPVFQNPHGQLLRDITAEPGDVGRRYGKLETPDGSFLSSRARTASSAPLRFHTDRCDVVGLLCTGIPARGGESRLVSSVTVHNEMLASAPHLCQLLYQDVPRSRIGEEEGGESAWYNLPVWGVQDGKFTSHYSRTYIEALTHVPGAPVVDAEVWQALDLLAEIADRHALDMTLRRGDIQFLNNHVIYHSRGEFEDEPESGLVRSLSRIWLSAPHRSLPPSHAVLWQHTEAGENRGGIRQGPQAAGA